MNIFEKWLNESNIAESENLIQISAPERTDYFINPENGQIKNNAPFLYTDIQGDFVFRAKVRHDFISKYDGAALFIMDSDHYWS